MTFDLELGTSSYFDPIKKETRVINQDSLKIAGEGLIKSILYYFGFVKKGNQTWIEGIIPRSIWCQENQPDPAQDEVRQSLSSLYAYPFVTKKHPNLAWTQKLGDGKDEVDLTG